MLVRSRLDRRLGEECAARWPAPHPRQVRAARRVLRESSAAAPWCDTRAVRAPRDSNTLTKNLRAPRRRPVVVLVQLSLNRRRRDDGAHRELADNIHAKQTLRETCSAVRRPLLHGAIRARDARHGILKRWERLFEYLAANRSQCWCGRASAGGVGMDRAAHWLTPQPRQVHAAKRVLHFSIGRYSMVRYASGTRAAGFERAGQDLLNLLLPTDRSVGAFAPRPTAWGGARRMLARTTSTPSPRCAARAPCSVGRYSMVRYARGTRASGYARAA